MNAEIKQNSALFLFSVACPAVVFFSTKEKLINHVFLFLHGNDVIFSFCAVQLESQHVGDKNFLGCLSQINF